jgi:glycine cleavage system transcriptional repressor
VTDIAVTVVGPDRPGIVADVSAALADLRLNLTDSTMTLLRGHFAMMLICSPRSRARPQAGTDSGSESTTDTATNEATTNEATTNEATTNEATTNEAATNDAAMTVAAVTAALRPLTESGHLIATARALDDQPSLRADGAPYTLVVHGADRLGIVAAMTAVLAHAGGNITDLTTRLAGALYLLTAEVDLPVGVDVDAVSSELVARATRLGVTASLTAAEADML